MFDGVKDMIHLEGLAKRNYSWRYGVNKCKHIEILTSKCILILNGLGRRLHAIDSSSSASSLQTRVPEHSMRPGQAPLPCKPRQQCEKIDFWFVCLTAKDIVTLLSKSFKRQIFDQHSSWSRRDFLTIAAFWVSKVSNQAIDQNIKTMLHLWRVSSIICEGTCKAHSWSHGYGPMTT